MKKKSGAETDKSKIPAQLLQQSHQYFQFIF